MKRRRGRSRNIRRWRGSSRNMFKIRRERRRRRKRKRGIVGTG